MNWIGFPARWSGSREMLYASREYSLWMKKQPLKMARLMPHRYQ
jgi:hypothetical protein